jgi:hypothetical protein
MQKNVLRCLLYCGLIFIFAPWTATAEFYQYTDQNGNLIFTDDVSRIPANQRDKIKRYNSVQPLGNLSDETVDRSDLEKQKTDTVSVQREKLERDYFRLQQTRKDLMKEKEQVTTQAEQQAYNEKVTRLNQQIELFSQQLDSFNKAVLDENADPGAE